VDENGRHIESGVYELLMIAALEERQVWEAGENLPKEQLLPEGADVTKEHGICR
jgi:hypothetical protein